MLPCISQHVIFMDSVTKNTSFLYHLKNHRQDVHKENQAGAMIKQEDNQGNVKNPPELDDGADSITPAISTKQKGGPYKVCYGDPSDFLEMLVEFWPCIMKFTEENSKHDHTAQWKIWLDKVGLTYETDLITMKAYFGVKTLDQLYPILCDSLAINAHYYLAWDHKIYDHPKIQNEHFAQNEINNVSAYTGTSNLYEPFTSHPINMHDNSETEFIIFHKLMYDTISKWDTSDGAKLHNNWMQWIKSLAT